MDEQTEESVHNPPEEVKAPTKEELLKTPEGQLLTAGTILAFGYLFWLVLMLIFSTDQAQVLVGMTATEILFGRAAAMAFGYSLGLSGSMVIFVCALLETVLVLLFYPLFVFSFRHLLQWRWLKRSFDRIHRSAELHKGKVQRYGIIGLFVFVWLPFFMTGPVVGCVIGFLLGLRVRTNMAAVLAGTYTAIVGWAVFMRTIHDHAASTSSYAAVVLLILLLILMIVSRGLHKALSGGPGRKGTQ